MLFCTALVLLSIGLTILVEIPLLLVLGWIYFLWKTLPSVQPDWSAIGINQGPKSFGSPFFGGCNMLLADGSVLFVSESIAPQLLKALSTPASGESVRDEF